MRKSVCARPSMFVIDANKINHACVSYKYTFIYGFCFFNPITPRPRDCRSARIGFGYGVSPPYPFTRYGDDPYAFTRSICYLALTALIYTPRSASLGLPHISTLLFPIPSLICFLFLLFLLSPFSSPSLSFIFISSLIAPPFCVYLMSSCASPYISCPCISSLPPPFSHTYYCSGIW